MINAVRSALTGGTRDLATALIWSAALIIACIPISRTSLLAPATAKKLPLRPVDPACHSPAVHAPGRPMIVEEKPPMDASGNKLTLVPAWTAHVLG
jgi:hypothetical protein